MKSVIIEPTEKNIVETILADDFARLKDVISFIKLLNQIEGHYALALDGDWGSGKTFFIKQAEYIINYVQQKNSQIDYELTDPLEIQSRAKLDEKLKSFLDDTGSCNQLAIYYDAWSNDYVTDPLLSLVISIIRSYNLTIDNHVTTKDKVVNGLKNIVRAIELNASIAGMCSISLPLSKVLEKPESNNAEHDIFETLKKEQNLHTLFQEFFNSLAESLEVKRIVIFIDELDRCKPDFAVKLLEKIKHYCMVDNVTFVFAINSRELSCTLKSYYGTEFNGTQYLDKIFDMRSPLPEVDKISLYKALGITGSYYYYEMIRAIADMFHLQIRELQKFIAYMDDLVKPYYPIGSGVNFLTTTTAGIRIFVPIICALSLKDSSQKDRFIQGEEWPLLEQLINNYPIIEYTVKYSLYYSNDKVTNQEVRDNFKKLYEITFKYSDKRNIGDKIGFAEIEQDAKQKILEQCSCVKIEEN